MYRVAIIAALLLPAFCLADTIVFKNGQELEGKIIEQDAASVLVQVEYGTLRIARDKIEKITPDTPEKLAKRELERQAAETAKAQAKERQPAAKPNLADVAKAVQKKAKTAGAPAPAPATQANAQPNQPSWADQYIQYRRTMHNQENKATNDLRTARQRADRQSLLTGDPRNISRQVNSGNPLRTGGNSRGRLPSGINDLPDIAKKYIGGM